MSTAARVVYLVALLSLCGCATPREPDYYADAGEVAQICAAAIRFRLAAAPLPPHRQLNIFIDSGVVSKLAAQLSEYQVRVRSGSAGSHPPAGRWYWLRLGRVTPKQAFIMIRGSGAPLRGLELRKRDGSWMVVDDRQMILTQLRRKTPNQAMQRTASKPATDVLSVCHPRFCFVARCSGLAVADLVSR